MITTRTIKPSWLAVAMSMPSSASVVREHVSLNGIPLRINDTAGLQDSDNPVEQEGVKRAWQEIARADRVLLLVDASVGITEADESIARRLESNRPSLIFSKSDLVDEGSARNAEALYISTVSGDGMEALKQLILGNFHDYNQDNKTIMARRRHVDALIRARDSLQQAGQVFADTSSAELVAEDLRIAQQFLNEITGEFTPDNLLGRIFSNFCIGK